MRGTKKIVVVRDEHTILLSPERKMLFIMCPQHICFVERQHSHPAMPQPLGPRRRDVLVKIKLNQFTHVSTTPSLPDQNRVPLLHPESKSTECEEWPCKRQTDRYERKLDRSLENGIVARLLHIDVCLAILAKQDASRQQFVEVSGVVCGSLRQLMVRDKLPECAPRRVQIRYDPIHLISFNVLVVKRRDTGNGEEPVGNAPRQHDEAEALEPVKRLIRQVQRHASPCSHESHLPQRRGVEDAQKKPSRNEREAGAKNRRLRLADGQISLKRGGEPPASHIGKSKNPYHGPRVLEQFRHKVSFDDQHPTTDHDRHCCRVQEFSQNQTGVDDSLGGEAARKSGQAQDRRSFPISASRAPLFQKQMIAT